LTLRANISSVQANQFRSHSSIFLPILWPLP
jgi:hypothetical protein